MSDPPWLTAAVDQRLALVDDVFTKGVSLATDLILMPLTEPAEDNKTSADYWERACDNCGKYCVGLDPFWTGHVQRVLRGKQIIITFGVCQACHDGFAED